MKAVDPNALPTERTGPLTSEDFIGMSRLRSIGRGVFAGAGVLTLIIVAAADGGYFASSWGWITLAFLIGAANVLLVIDHVRPGNLMLAISVALGGLALLSTVVGSDHGLEPFRGVLYLAAALALSCAGATLGTRILLGSALIATVATCLYALASRLFPTRLGSFDSVAGYRLAEPLGYWNALGIFAAMGALLALGVAARSRSRAERVLAAAALPVLLCTLYFTFSRGAWIALLMAILAIAAVDHRRIGFVATAAALSPMSLVLLGVASRQDALTTVGSPLERASAEGHRLALWLLACVLLSGLTGTAVSIFAKRRFFGRRSEIRFVAALVAALALLGTVGVERFGAPWTVAGDAWRSFSSPPSATQNLNERLFTFSSNGRIELWDAAWENYKDHPLMGSGAGTFEHYWLENRDIGLKVRDAHSLYLETLSELGPLGLALLLLALGVPVYAAFKARGHPLVPAAFGAYVAYLVHAGVDWDWEMPAVTLTALFIGASIVVAARKPEDEERLMSPRLRYGLLTGTLALAAVAFVGLVGNMALAQSADAARAGDWDESESKARRAETWTPWSPEPWQRIGQAQLGRGELADARASFRTAIDHDERDWNLWLDLARASAGKAQLLALAQATKLNPLSPEIAQLRKELAELGTIEVEG